ncbi:MAG: sigma-70 family RNA polymerase sigma factor, partial [Verrucomicrobiae bacterium]|nr:sigma-70 family RNA polymerase sigma factor [Verrucomicrobiae bacterium]
MTADPSRFQPFPETRWSLVLRAGSEDEAAKNDALTDLYSLYWPPVYAYVRSRGHAPRDAEDLVQGFFLMLMERDDLCKPDSS